MPRLQVEPAAAGQRVDRIVAQAVPGLSAAAARRLIEDGAVRVDGRRPRKGERVAAGQTVDIDDARLEDRHAPPLPDPELPIEVLHADDALIAIAKPAGAPTHPLRPGQLGTAANAIVARFPECATASPDPREGGLVHRLDTGTSGVLLAARRADVWPRLRAALLEATCEKTYLAEVLGRPLEHDIADAPIGRVGRRGTRVRVDGGRNPLPARTEWETIERRGETALVRARLHAGRAHQVRAHLAAAGTPIVGDPTYGSSPADATGGGLHLHAASIRFRHPISGDFILIQAPPPDWAMMRA